MIKRLFRRLFPSKEMRAYNKMHRRHMKELVKHAKETKEYDYYWLHESVILQIRHMLEYYESQNNVWQTDETRIPVINQLRHIIALQEELDNLYTEYDNFQDECHREEELYKEIYTYIGENIQWWWD